MERSLFQESQKVCVCVCVCVCVLGMLTHVFLTADSEMSHLQITVPQKLGTNTNDGDASELLPIKKLFYGYS